MQSFDRFMDRDIYEISKFINKNYKLFLVVGFILVLGTFLFNQISIPRYKITSQVLIKSESSNQNRSLTNVLNFSILGDNTNFNNELLKIKSIPLVEKVIENLDLEVAYFTKGKFKYSELYSECPIKVNYVNDHLQIIGAKFELKVLNNQEYLLSVSGKDLYTYNYEKKHFVRRILDVNIKQKGKFGELIENKYFAFIVKFDAAKYADLGKKTIHFEFFPITELALAYQKSLTVEASNEKVTSGVITYDASNPDKGIDIINMLCNVYIEDDLNRRNHLANVTIQYIDKLLGEVTDSLSSSEKELQRIKSANQIFDVGQQSSAINQQLLDIEKQLGEIRSRIRYYTYVKNHLADNKSISELIVPASIGINDQTLSNLITELSNLTTERSGYNDQEKSPQLKIINSKIESIKNSIYGNINYLLKTLEINESELQSQSGKLNAEISKLPLAQRQLFVYERKFKLNDAIFTFLQERRAEANITMASNISNIEIIEPAINVGKVFPKKSQNYILALILSFVIPIVIISLKDRYRVTFDSHEEVSKLTNKPILGKLLHVHKKDQRNIFENTNSPYVESLRLLRTNLDYFIRNSTRQVILITSSSENEGKSHTAYNLALSFAMLRKRTILLSYDLRKPTKYLGSEPETTVGLTSYYIGKATMEDIIINTENEYFDVISAGNIPPNPAELIELDKTKTIFNTLKNIYEYIIVDSPPLHYFTDAFLLMKQSDINLLVVRQGITNKHIFSRICDNIEEKAINNVAIIYNDIPVEGEFKYGYKYYSQDLTKKQKKKKKQKGNKVPLN